ncbi:hypothetical protein [Lacticaseibacillus sp. N501-2]|uniref:hypothetical protein n=1 Tax=Lacticaseibacillus salsurae TaxID=3367729 RepID=UPI0038B362D2
MKSRLNTATDFVTDHSISLKAKGLLCYMICASNQADLTLDALTQSSTDGRSAIRSALHELVASGYLTEERERHEGQFGPMYRFATAYSRKEENTNGK